MKKRLSFADENKRGVSKNMNPMAEAVENRGTSVSKALAFQESDC
ncbi:unnamed protein product [Meloidogyne enterolobii]|uniref:Uncharacterized protein n=1 Tax=Meloidogyne enterolobii TaxID=390850 RepID=A0ACB0YMG9_MELEN